MLPDDVLDYLERRFGCASRPQLRSLGHTDAEISGWVREHHIEKFFSGTFRRSGGGVPPEQAAMAAVLRCRPKARVAGPFVLGLFGVEGFTVRDPFEILVPAGRRVQNVPFTVLRDPDPARFRAMWRGVLPIAAPPLSAVYAARTVRGKRLLTGLDSLRWRRLASSASLLEAARLVSHEGGSEITGLIGDGHLEQESHGERAMKDALVGFEPQPEWQVWVTPAIRVDGLMRDVMLVLEYASEEHHGAPHQRADDAARDEQLREHGYHVEHITDADLAQPEALRARLHLVRLARARELGLL